MLRRIFGRKRERETDRQKAGGYRNRILKIFGRERERESRRIQNIT
jgi:hypothetical protein